LYLLAAAMIVASLALTVPASCWCAHDTHAGMLLHPLFPHHHPGDDAAFVDDAAEDAAPLSLSRASASISPTVPGDPGTGGFGGAEIVLPMLVVASVLLSWRRLPSEAASPDQHLISPLTPPPRARIVALSPLPLV
jgi:hypothetical protein